MTKVSSITLLIVFLLPLCLPAQEYTIREYEIVRNGSFTHGNGAWFVLGNYSGLYPEASADRFGAGMSLVTTTADDSTSYIMQQLYPPTSVTNAVFRAALRFEAKSGAQFGGLQISIASSQNNQIQPVITLAQRDNSNYGGFEWQRLEQSLSASEANTLTRLRQQGQPLYLYIQLSGQWVTAHLDSISLTLSGSMRFPAMNGTIAFANLTSGGREQTFQIASIDPTGANSRILYENSGQIYGLEWKPDGTGLIFSSSQEMSTSPFTGDIFSLSRGRATKLTLGNDHLALRKKGGATGTVRGRVTNGARRTALVAVMVSGAPQAEFLTLAPYPQPGHEKTYTIENVVDAGNRPQTVHAREGSYVWIAPVGVDVIPGGTATAADLRITSAKSSYTAGSLSFNNDGSEIYFTFPEIMSILSTGGIPTVPQGWNSSIPALALDHSPAGQRLVYIDSAGQGIWEISGGSQPRQLVQNNAGSLLEGVRWTADGAGFVFIQPGSQNPSGSPDIHYYHGANGQVVPLTMLFNESAHNPCPSPDGRYVVFERLISSGDSMQGSTSRQLWIMQADNPAVMWPLVTTGEPRLPRWR